MTDNALLRRVADELDIRNIISSLALLGDTGDLKEYENLFADDIHWEMTTSDGSAPLFPPVKGRKAIVAASQKRRDDKISGPGTHHYHLVDTTAVKLDGDKASAKTYLIFLKNADTKPHVGLFKIYRDEFVRTPDGWKLSARYIDPA
jgi:hypothetical protein